MSRKPHTRGHRYGIAAAVFALLLLVASLVSSAAGAAPLNGKAPLLPTVCLPLLCPTTGPLPTVPLPTVPVPTVPLPTVGSTPIINPTVVLPTVQVTVPPIGATVQPTLSLSPTNVAVGVGATVSICGPVTAYVSPTQLGTGSITIAGQTFQLAQGASLSGAGVVVGSDLCLSASLNAGGQITGGTVSVHGGASLHICGLVTAITSPTQLSSGSVTIGGQTIQLAQGATLSGAQLTVGSTFCLDGSTNPQGQISNGTVTASAPTALNLCGVVDGYLAPTSVSAGSITIGGQTIVIAPGTTFTGAGITTGSQLCGAFTTNPQGQISGGNITASAPTNLTLCGVVSAFTAPTNVQTGSITIGGQTLTLAPGTVLSGAAVQVGSSLCAALTTNPQGQVTGGQITVQAPTDGTVCGVVTSYLAATSTMPGSITISGTTIILPIGYVPASGVLVGTNLCLILSGGVPVGSGTATPGPGGGGSGSGTATAIPGGSGNGTATPVPGGTFVTGGGSGNPTATPGGPGNGPGTPGPGGNPGSGTPTPGSGSGSGAGVGAPGTPYPAAAGNLVEYVLPHGAGPYHVEWDAHHNLWITEFNRGRVAELMAGTHTLREFSLSSPTSRPHALVIDRHGNVWVGENGGNRVDELIPSGGSVTFRSWILPHANSQPEGITVAANGTVWIAEHADRIAHFNPSTGRIDEYATFTNAHPHAIQMDRTLPVYVGEDTASVVWIHLNANGKAKFVRSLLPKKNGRPNHIAMMPNGVGITDMQTGAVVWMDGGAGVSHMVTPVTHHLRPTSTSTTGLRTGLSVVRYRITPRLYRVKMLKGTHFVQWNLPHPRSQPYGIRCLNQGKRMWMTEDRGNRVALLQTAKKRLLEYDLPQKHSAPKELEVRKVGKTTQVWIAAYGIDRLALLTTNR